MRLVAKARPDLAVARLVAVLGNGSIRRRQAAYAALGALSGPEADALISARLDDLTAGKVPAELELDLLQAAGTRKGGEIASKVARFDAERAAGDHLAGYRESLAGGSVRRGRKVFLENTAAGCLRCHKVEGKGGEVGPAVDGIADRRDRRYLLESLVAPDRQIAEGFETTVVAMADGRVHSGIAKGEDDATLRLITADGKAIALPKAEIEERKRGASAMPSDIVKQLNKGEIRDLVEYLSTLRAIPKAGDGHGPG